MIDPDALSDLMPKLNHLLNQWDPIGVADLVNDEYLCLVGPILGRLSADEGSTEVTEFLWRELEDHFGLDPAGLRVEETADRLAAWAAAVL